MEQAGDKGGGPKQLFFFKVSEGNTQIRISFFGPNTPWTLLKTPPKKKQKKKATIRIQCCCIRKQLCPSASVLCVWLPGFTRKVKGHKGGEGAAALCWGWWEQRVRLHVLEMLLFKVNNRFRSLFTPIKWQIYLAGNLTRVHRHIIYRRMAGNHELQGLFWPSARSALIVRGHSIYSPCLFRLLSNVCLP